MNDNELPPPRVHGQRSDTCAVCGGPIRYYPRPGVDADTADADIVGNWAHLNPDDWIGDPHTPDPAR